MTALRLSSVLFAIAAAVPALAAGQGADSSAAAEVSALEQRMVKLVTALDYDKETATAFAKLASSWQADDGARLVEQWRATLEKAQADRKSGALWDKQLAGAELAVVGY